MNELKVFENPTFGQVRTIEEEFAKSPIHNLFVRLAPNASTALKNDERRSEEETK